MKRPARLFCLGLVLLAVFLAYLPSLGNGFVTWDDNEYVYENPAVKELSWHTLRSYATGFQVANYHPLTMLSYTVDYRLFGLDARGYHAVNLAFHLLTCLLVFWVADLLGAGAVASLTAALLFGLHPLHVESVAWIAERKDVLAACFFFLALGAWLKARAGPRRRLWYGLALASLLFSLLAKSMGVSFPLVLLLVDVLHRRRLDRAAWLEKVPFAFLAAVFAAIAVWAQRSSGAMRLGANYPLSKNLLVAAHGLVFYLEKLLLPLHLSALYPYTADAGQPLPLSFRLAPIPLVILAAAAACSWRRTRIVACGALYFLVTLLPVLQIVQVGNAFAADRYTYIPSFGPFLLAGIGAAWLLDRLRGQSLFRRVLAGAALAAAVIALAWLTCQRTLVWHDGVTLWSDVLRRYPRSSLAWNNRGNAWADRRDYDRALADYDRALELKPDYARAWYSRGNALAERKDYSGALRDFGQALLAAPEDAKSWYNRGIVRLQMGNAEEAAADFQRAIAIDPGKDSFHNNLGLALAALGRQGEAEASYRRALQLNPRSVDAHGNLGILLSDGGRMQEAIGQYLEALRADPGSVEAHFNLAADLAALGRREEAAAHYREVLRLAPGHPQAAAALAGLARTP